MFGLSFFEILFLAILALIVIGPKELPVVARTLGRFLNDLKRTTNGLTDELKQHARIDRIDLNEAPQKPNNPQPQHAEKESGFSTSTHAEPHSPHEVHSPIETHNPIEVQNTNEVHHHADEATAAISKDAKPTKNENENI
jgi:sec-independent protein translocase protein TatB